MKTQHKATIMVNDMGESPHNLMAMQTCSASTRREIDCTAKTAYSSNSTHTDYSEANADQNDLERSCITQPFGTFHC